MSPTPPSPPTSLPLSQAHTLLTSFTAFLTVAIHSILFHRAIYPPATFLSTKAYNLPVHQNRHPRVCAWILDAVAAVSAQLASGFVERVAVVLHAPLSSSSSSSSVAPGAVLERWLFDVRHFPAWPGGADAMRAYGAMRDDGEEGDGEPEEGAAAEEENGSGDGDSEDEQQVDEASVNWVDVDEQLRGVLRRLAHAGEKMGALPEGCTFTVAVELREEGEAPIGHPQPWIPSQPNLQRKSKGRPTDGQDVVGVNTTPIRAVEAGPLFFECWVEEGRAKDALKSPPQTEETTQVSS